MSKDKFDYLNPSQIYRFPFTTTSIQWGITTGALLACHKYSRTRNPHPGILKEAMFTGVQSGIIAGAASWAYYMFQFTKQTHVIQRQMQMREEQSRKAEYIRTYFKDKYQLQE